MKHYASTMLLIISLFSSGQLHALCAAANANTFVPEATPTSAFTDHLNGTVTHTLTGLMWKQCAQGMSGAGCVVGTPLTMTWADALTAAVSDTTAGYDDWRLPNAKELDSIVETCGRAPAINQTIFPRTQSAQHWSSTSYQAGATAAWAVNFNDGALDNSLLKSNATPYVRLVRGGQSRAGFDALAPLLTAVGTSAVTSNGLTLAATSNLAATGYWMVVAQGSAVPTAVQVKAGANYGSVTVAAVGSGAMSAATAKDFVITGLAASTAYDVYLIAYDANNKAYSMASKATVTTAAVADTIPTALGFVDVDGAFPNALIYSNIINIAGINAATSISVTGGQYSVNGGFYTNAAGTVNNDDSVQLRVTSSSIQTASVNVVVNVGGVIDTFTVTSADMQPDPFTFIDEVGVAPGAWIISKSVALAGIVGASPISVVGGEYQINSGHFTAVPGIVRNGDVLLLRAYSSTTSGSTVNAVLSVGNVSDTFSVTTMGERVVPGSGTSQSGGGSIGWGWLSLLMVSWLIGRRGARQRPCRV